jgi:ketosteroid isomerase-like protein
MNDLDTFLTTWSNAERERDATTTDQLLTDDFMGIGPVGYQLPKSAWLERQTSGDLHYDALHLDEITSRRYGDCAVTTARWNARGTAQGHPIPEATRITLVTVRGHGEWRLAGIHFSFIAGTPGAPGGRGPS